MIRFTFSFFCVCFCSVVISKAFGCKTPEQKPGECVPLPQCAPLFNILKQQPLADNDKNYLRLSQCGFEGTHPLVCCAVEDKDEITSNLLPDLATCGQSRETKIVGGTQAGLYEFPWLALLEYETPSGRAFKCGGSLINDRYVLTAAHCLADLPWGYRLVNVRLGEYDVTTEEDCDLSIPEVPDCLDPPINFKVETQIVHPSADIALLRLDSQVPYSKHISPICLPVSSELRAKDYGGIAMVVAGWGRTENRSDSDVKLKVEVPVKSIEDCSAAYQKYRRQLNTDQICAGGIKGKDSCTGDSGGPLMYHRANRAEDNWYAIGVVSFGPRDCGTEGVPGVYVRIPSFMPWIIENLKP